MTKNIPHNDFRAHRLNAAKRSTKPLYVVPYRRSNRPIAQALAKNCPTDRESIHVNPRVPKVE